MSFEPQDRGRLGRAGVERRERLLADLRPVVAGRGRRRRAVAWSLMGCVAVAGAVLVAQVSGRRVPRPRAEVAAGPVAPVVEPSVTMAVAAPGSEPVVELVATSKGIADRVATRTTGAAGASDEDLMEALRAVGQDPGLVRVEGRVVVAGDFRRE